MHRLILLSVLALPLFNTVSKAETTLKLGHTLPTDSQFGVGERAFAAELEKLLPKHYKIDEQPASKLGGDSDMIKALQLGTLEMMIVGGGGAIGNVVPEVSVLDLPFLLKDYAQADKVLDGPIGDELLAAHTAHGVIAIGWGEQGFRQITNAVRPIRTASDLKGLKIRVPQSETYLAAFRNLGADVQVMPFPEVYPGLKIGKIDGQENSISTIVAGKLYEVQKYISLTNHIYSVATFLVSPDIWEELSESDRQAFKAAAKVGGKAMREYVRKKDTDGLAALKQNGMEVLEAVDRDSFVAATQPSYAALDPKIAAMVKRIRETK